MQVVGEWTKVPDQDMAQMEEDCARKGLAVRVRNAEPYREFQNVEDNDRYYGMNEGYWRNMAVNPLNAAQVPPPPQVHGAFYQTSNSHLILMLKRADPLSF